MKEQYQHIPSGHKGTPPVIKVGEPVFVNPSSYKNIKIILRNIGSECGIERYCKDDQAVERQWMFVVADGLPMNLIFKLMDDSVICTICGQPSDSQEKLKHHFIANHPEEYEQRAITFVHEFDWLLPRVGSGHYEMNMVKAFFEINWSPCLKALCYAMGFQSTAALASAKRCANYHKAWLLLLIFHIGTLKELVRPYVMLCRANGIAPTPVGYMDYVDKTHEDKSDNYMLYFEMVLRYSLAIIEMRMGVRRNNASLVWTAKHKFKELIHARNHPKYQEIEIYDSLYHEQAPSAVKEFVDGHVGVSRSGNHSLGQDIDFIMEEENRKCKQLLPPGLPSEKKWETICRNVFDLHELRDRYHSMVGKEKSTPGNSIQIKSLTNSANIYVY